MSLNGLDTGAVTTAYQNTLAEAGGWFLLHYVNRDTVELLHQGSGGVTDVRGKIEQYEEKSPLYGLVQHRRKKIILKYVPEGTSRLLKVRLTVQFQSILEAFTPHDTVFTFTSAAELNESALGLCSMPTGGSLTSSSSSLRRRTLNEITEDAEEATPRQGAAARVSQYSAIPTTSADRPVSYGAAPASALKAKAMLARRREEEAAAIGADTTDGEEVTKQPKFERQESLSVRRESLTPRPALLQVPIVEKSLPTTSDLTPPATSVGRSSLIAPEMTKKSPFRSLQSEREGLGSIIEDDASPGAYSSKYLSGDESSSISQWTSEVAAHTLPEAKQKRGPRPHVDLQHPTGTTGSGEPRPTRKVANLPTSVRVQNRLPSNYSTRPGSQQSTRSVPTRFAASTPILSSLGTPSGLVTSAFRQQDSRPVTSRASSVTSEVSVASPEKVRLMKALQMRKRNQALTHRVASAQPTVGGLTSVDTSSSLTSTASVDVPPSISSRSSAVSSPNDTVLSQELKAYGGLGGPSPISVTAASEHPSTKPSSLSDRGDNRKSAPTVSSDTNSSTTPKAENDADTRALASGASERSDRLDRYKLQLTTPRAISPIDEAFMRLTGSPTLDASSAEPPYVDAAASTGTSPSEGSPARLNESLAPGPSTHLQVTTATKSKGRRVFDGHVKIPTSTTASDVSDDDSFMEELRNATVQEATPMSVARTPATPILSKMSTDRLPEVMRGGSLASPKTNESTRSTPEHKSRRSRTESIRSTSTALPQWPPTQAEPVPLTKKPNLGSSISNRIKALEGLTYRESGPPSPVLPRDKPARASTFSALTQGSGVFSRFQSTSDVDRSPRLPVTPTQNDRPERRPESPSPRAWVQPQGTATEVFPPSHKGETVSVTARIVRGHKGMASAGHGTNPSIADLYRSPLIVEHEQSQDATPRPRIDREASTQSVDAAALSPMSEKRRFSFSSQRPKEQRAQSDSVVRRMSYGNNQKKLPRSTSETSTLSEEKRASRTSRMFKRLSGLGSRRTGRENMSSPTKDVPKADTIHESQWDSHVPRTSLAGDSMLHVVDIGDVNVQFPGSLLWKRRFLRIDDQGYLIFAPPTNDFRGRSRKYHLSLFKAPCLPDMEREEMACSILLDLVEGGSIQCACESKQSQRRCLKMLFDAYQAYNQLFGE